uniref:B-cell receptor-associated protein n=1 Tax=Saimiri boliviensis boliviensis TaxID=39432 RepID=A0A2K6SN95_SAIBB
MATPSLWFSLPSLCCWSSMPCARFKSTMITILGPGNTFSVPRGIWAFSLLLSFLFRRLVTLISWQATLLASNEAFKRQAETRKYLEENEQLRKGAAVNGGKLDVGNAEVKLEEENRSLKADLQKLTDKLASTKQKREKAENQALAMQKQSEGLTKEYDRLLEEHAKLQAAVDGPTDKEEE